MHITGRETTCEGILHQRHADPIEILHDQQVRADNEFLMQ
jgi:hypothetical protein